MFVASLDEGTIFVREHKVDPLVIPTMTDPELIAVEFAPTGGQAMTLLVVGASVLIVGRLVGPLS